MFLVVGVFRDLNASVGYGDLMIIGLLVLTRLRRIKHVIVCLRFYSWDLRLPRGGSVRLNWVFKTSFVGLWLKVDVGFQVFHAFS
jgi:hypothetical protein